MAVKSHICLLGLIILCSLLTGMSEAEVTVFSSSGENVALPCFNALSDCISTTWTYSKPRTSVTVELIAGGIKNKNIERAERLSLGSDCSLNIYKITEEDHGKYTCQQYMNGQKHGMDAQAFLHVLHVSSSSTQTEMRSGSSLTLTCQLFSYDNTCDGLIRTEDLQLFWVNQVGVNLQTDSRYQILSSGQCIKTLTTTLLNEDNNTELRCLVQKKNEIKTSASYTVKLGGMSEAEVTVFSSSGENVTLACINALSDCTSTTWTYTKHSSSGTVELIAGGIKNKNIERAERLSLGSDCSLNIYKTTKDDHGQYTCQQYVNGQKHGTDAQAFLHVLHVSSSSAQTEIRSGSSVTLTCQFFTFDNTCDSLVRYENLQLFWVNQADVNLQTDSRYQMLSSGPCIITLTTTLLNEDNNTELRCLVKMKNEIKTSVSYTVKLEGKKS
ncbi:uncharacterized protein [Misgurnus anguillicaudatus]|uniref:uncharacterized protein n=1 Tax=Misgurnus anguillicaudatus TaxID=75329 RepID=UPI003CCF847C